METERAMMKAADEVIVVADSSKFGRSSLALLCPPGRSQHLVVDDEIATSGGSELTDAGVRLVIAGSRPSDD